MASRAISYTPPRLRQIALLAEDLEKARHLLTKVIGTEVVFEDPAVEQWGLNNFLVPIGGDFIEVVSPFRADAPASRQLRRKGGGGYMIIMQTLDALSRKDYVESRGLAKVIFCHETEHSTCVQYHPKGIKGGMMPELDSHKASRENPDPLGNRFSPWHAAGPPSSHKTYSEVMKRHADLHLLSVTLRLASGDQDVAAAAEQWRHICGVRSGHDKGELWFTNSKLEFVSGKTGKNEGLVEIDIGVEGKKAIDAIFERARKEGLVVKDGRFDMLGTTWRFLKLNEDMETARSHL